MKWDPDAIVSVVFSNADATPKKTVIRMGGDAVASVMAWYAGYHAGDRYTVRVDGRLVPMDGNGEPLP